MNKSNVPFCATVNNKNYVISSSNTSFENVDYDLNIKINSMAFGVKSYTYKRDNLQKKASGNLDWELECLRFYRCSGPTVKANNQYFKFLYLLSQNINERNIQLYRILETWIKTNAIPVSAIRYINEIIESLGGL